MFCVKLDVSEEKSFALLRLASICLSTYDHTEINQPIIDIICRHLEPVYCKVRATVRWAHINISWLLLNKTICSSVRESQGKVALKRQGKTGNFLRTSVGTLLQNMQFSAHLIFLQNFH